MINMVLIIREWAATTLAARIWPAYLLVEIEASELHSRIWYNPYTVRAVPSHETSPAFVSPHLHEALPNRQLVFRPPSTLYLEQNLEALEW